MHSRVASPWYPHGHPCRLQLILEARSQNAGIWSNTSISTPSSYNPGSAQDHYRNVFLPK